MIRRRSIVGNRAGGFNLHLALLIQILLALDDDLLARGKPARDLDHILVAKGAKGGVTTADVRVLDGDDRVVEVARMLGGDPESQVSRAHARELLDSAAVPTGAPAMAASGSRARRR